MTPPPEKKSKKGIVGAVIVLVILIGAMGTYFVVLAPRMSVVDWSHEDFPLPANLTHWQYGFTVVVKNEGSLTGKTTIVCTFSFEDKFTNSTAQNRTFEGSLKVQLKGGEQEEFPVYVRLPLAYAAASLLTQNKTWSTHLD
jgi:hypothetical protein